MRALLEASPTLVLATADHGARGWATPLFYVSDRGLRLYWLSDAAVRHSREAASDHEVGVAIFSPAASWRRILGVQFVGRVSRVRDAAARARQLGRYRRKYELGTELDSLLARSNMYVFRPSWLRLIDNARGLGFKVEVSLAAARSPRHGSRVRPRRLR